MLRDRLICGINNDRMQHRLLAESKLSFEKAYELAQAMDTADHDAKELQGPLTAAVNKLNRGAGRNFSIGTRLMTSLMTHKNSRNNCYRCGGKHSTNNCRFHQSECRFCKKVGHIKEHAASSLNRVREEKQMLPAKFITCRFPVMIQPMVANQRCQINIQCIMSGVATHQ